MELIVCSTKTKLQYKETLFFGVTTYEHFAFLFLANTAQANNKQPSDLF